MARGGHQRKRPKRAGRRRDREPGERGAADQPRKKKEEGKGHGATKKGTRAEEAAPEEKGGKGERGKEREKNQQTWRHGGQLDGQLRRGARTKGQFTRARSRPGERKRETRGGRNGGEGAHTRTRERGTQQRRKA